MTEPLQSIILPSDSPSPTGQGAVVATRFWQILDDGRVQCDLCPRACKLKEGARGLCFVRARQNDEIVLTTYGRSAGFCIDPMEKKPLNHFLPGTPILSFGTAGCNLACNFCQNHDVSKSREMDRMSALAQPQSIAQAAAKLGCSAIAFTYNDPIIFHEYASDIAEACHDKGLKAVAVTAGYISDAARPPDVPLHFSAFHPDYRMKEHPRTPTATLARARQIALKNGVRHCYTGNVHDLGRQSSYCHGCGERVIGRDWYQLSDWQLDAHGRCLHCGTALPGVFDGPPGTWGRKRLAVDISAFG